MLRGMYAATTALDAAGQRQEQIAHNLAHISTPGYRARGSTFETFDRALNRADPPTGDILGTRPTGTYFDFKPGAVQQTGHPYDLAITNDSFFVLNTPEGPVYTRNGTFRLTPTGDLQSQDGYAVQGAGGTTITVPAGASFVNVSANGTVSADGANVGQIRLARFNDPTKLTAAGPTLFKAPDEAGLQEVDSGIVQGFREHSNVNAASSMVELIDVARYFDAAQRALRTIAESIQLNTKPS